MTRLGVVAHVMNLADLVLTLILMRMHPELEEANFFMRSYLNYGVHIFILVKVILGNGGIYIIDKYTKTRFRNYRWWLWVLTLMLTGIVFVHCLGLVFLPRN